MKCCLFNSQVSTSNLERVRKVKTRHQRLYTRVTTIREELQRFLEDDEDMMKMCLTRKKDLEQISGVHNSLLAYLWISHQHICVQFLVFIVRMNQGIALKSANQEERLYSVFMCKSGCRLVASSPRKETRTEATTGFE